VKSKIVAIAFALSLIFIQIGFSYYLSFQCLALLGISYLTCYSGLKFKELAVSLLAVLLFSISIVIEGYYAPLVISRNSSDIVVTIIAIIFYASIIAILPNLIIDRSGFLLKVFKYASALTVFSLALLMLVIDLGLISSLNRETLLLQNASLITNFSSIEILQKDISYREAVNGAATRHDLLYGEPSYLAIVLFTCVGCYMLTSKVISTYMSETVNSKADYGLFFKNSVVVIIGIISLLNIQSLSSIIYAIIILIFYFSEQFVAKRNLVRMLVMILFLTFVTYMFTDSFEYFLFRVKSINDSLSLYQRFGVLLDFRIDDYLFGLKDESRIPSGGFHNGLIYIVAISGFPGIVYLTFLIYKIDILARRLKMSSFLTLLFFAQIAQNGAVFSPNKIILYAMIFLPLSCVRPKYRTHLVETSNPNSTLILKG